MQGWYDSVHHDGGTDFLESGKTGRSTWITLKLRCQSDVPLKKVYLRHFQAGVSQIQAVSRKYEKDGFLWFEFSLKPSVRKLYYHFILSGEDGVWYYQRNNISRELPQACFNFCHLMDFKDPSWLKDRVFYQIFPDRFCNGDLTCNPENGSYSYDGGSVQTVEWDREPLEYQQGHCIDFYGGDFKGIEKGLDYLQELGVNALYLNPVFQARTHHRYDCEDYFKMDEKLGGDEAYLSLKKELESRDIRLMVDVSVNHVGTHHRWFNREGFHGDGGAYHDPNAVEREFFVKSNRGKFHKWMGVDTLVTLDYRSQFLRDIIYRKDSSVLQYWLGRPWNFDSWRFDVAHCMAQQGDGFLYQEVWRDIRVALKRNNPDCYLIAEFWDDATEFMQGDMWDGSMNYFGFTRPVRSFYGEVDWQLKHAGLSANASAIDGDVVASAFERALSTIPWQLQLCQYNLLGSHDMDRYNLSSSFKRDYFRGMNVLMFAFPGVPSVYYGEEILLEGHTRSTEGCRFPFDWKRAEKNPESLRFIKKLCSIRKTSDALKTGSFKMLYGKKGVVSFSRFCKDEKLVVVVSREGGSQKVSLPVGVVTGGVKGLFRDLISGEEFISGDCLNIELEPYAAMILSFTARS